MKGWILVCGRTGEPLPKRCTGAGYEKALADEAESAAGPYEGRTMKAAGRAVYIAPGRRARETADILFPEAEQVLCPELREMDFGSFDGRGWWEMEEDPAYRAWVDGGCRGRCPGGEDKAEFSERVNSCFERILEAETDKADTGEDLVIVAHGGTQMALLEKWGVPQREYYRWQRPCGCGWLLDWEPESKTLHVIREISFLR